MAVKSLKFAGLLSQEFYSMDVSNGGPVQKARGYEDVALDAPGLTIDVHRNTIQMGPEGVVFFARPTGSLAGPDAAFFNYGDGGVYDPKFHGTHITWNFGDTVRGFYHAQKLPDQKNNANFARGPQVAHTFMPGTYTITCTAVNWRLGVFASTTTEITVGDPLDLPASSIHFVDQAGDNTNAPPGANTYTNLGLAYDACDGATGTQWVILNWGTDFNPGSRNIREDVPNLMVTGPRTGSGPMPIYRLPTNGTTTSVASFNIGRHGQNGIKTIVLADIDFRGEFDSATETGNEWGEVFKNSHTGGDFQDDTQHVLMHNCKVSGGHQAYEGVTCQDAGRTVLFTDCFFTNWVNFAVSCFNGSADKILMAVGSSFVRKIDAISDGAKADDNVIHGPIRTGGVKYAAYLQCEFYTRSGWSLSIPVKAVQPWLRHNTGQIANSFLSVQDCYSEGGYLGVQITPDTNGKAVAASNSLFDGCVMIGGHGLKSFVGFAAGGLTMRNCLLVRCNARSLSDGGDFRRFWDVDNESGSTSTSRAAPVEFYGNTCVNFMDPANASSGTAELADLALRVNNYPRYRQEGNIILQPNQTNPSVADTAVCVLEALTAADGVSDIEPFGTLGYKNNDLSYEAGTGTPLDTVRLPKLVTAQRYSSDLSSAWDLMGNPRPDGPQMIGCFEGVAA
ncbi:hypothetical protein [Ruegeria sp. HKCCD6109]|uniref:hypothetical protein n=1 Tax=Ruegeria sp. HKCCD6109 TaxID=2683017 RepID=UPI001490B838|nr:hypothetical protein [Ruegeria sp. HKCCD6109]NOD65755.1 hypothetical protein [Ruegeria sp. HKCCD6109]